MTGDVASIMYVPIPTAGCPIGAPAGGEGVKGLGVAGGGGSAYT